MWCGFAIMYREVLLGGEQGWRSGESTRLTPMWPGFDSRSRRRKFPFRKRSLPFETVDATYNGRLHTSLQRKLKETN